MRESANPYPTIKSEGLVLAGDRETNPATRRAKVERAVALTPAIGNASGEDDGAIIFLEGVVREGAERSGRRFDSIIGEEARVAVEGLALLLPSLDPSVAMVAQVVALLEEVQVFNEFGFFSLCSPPHFVAFMEELLLCGVGMPFNLAFEDLEVAMFGGDLEGEARAKVHDFASGGEDVEAAGRFGDVGLQLTTMKGHRHGGVKLELGFAFQNDLHAAEEFKFDQA